MAVQYRVRSAPHPEPIRANRWWFLIEEYVFVRGHWRLVQRLPQFTQDADFPTKAAAHKAGLAIAARLNKGERIPLGI